MGWVVTEIVPTKDEMCTNFGWGLNEDIRMLMGEIELKEFVVLSKRAQKMEDMYHEKKQAKSKLRDSSKRSMTRSFRAPPLKRAKRTMKEDQLVVSFENRIANRKRH
ncbi:hypothetical protein Godav_021816 [Gossypium davidsonii]|uniref:Uncharacterized protein n=1 Tax=Gossypium davidsonii TaxID=34287 RepID=A0A7J8TA91_GOSDV|nr:hypothetical protein [Gossypium davidsonii]